MCDWSKQRYLGPHPCAALGRSRTMDAGDAAALVGELRYAFKRYGVQPQNKVVVHFVSKDGASLEITLDPSQGAISSAFEAPPKRSE